MEILIYLVPFLFITWIVLSIILYINRNKIIEKYNVGYISSFFFAAYMLTPLTLGIPALLSGSDSPEKTLGAIISLIYPAIGLIIFLIVYRKKSLNYKLGKFFAMIGIGICAALILVFKMLKLFHHSGSGAASPVSSYDTSYMPQSSNFYDADGKYRGYVNKYGQKYDADGKYRGYVNKYGQHYNADGKYIGYVNEYGQKYDADGKYRGHVNEYGQHYDANGKYTGRSDA